MTESYNGWPAHQDRRAIGVGPFVAAGASFLSGVKQGDVATVFRYLVEQFHARVERVDLPGEKDEWGYYYRVNRNAGNLSCHASGTAIDINATRHPNGRAGTFTSAQVRQIRQILSELNGVVRWGGDFRRTKDEMHFEIIGTPAEVAAAARKLTNREDEMTPAQMVDLKNYINSALAPLRDQVGHLDIQVKKIRRDVRELGAKAGLKVASPGADTVDGVIES